MTKILEKKKITTTVTKDILCNGCERTLMRNCLDSGGTGFYGLFAKVEGGYDSCSEIGDGNSWTFDLCEECVVDLFKTLKIPPQKDVLLTYE